MAFVAHQACLLDSVERWLVYSLSHYRRAFDMLVPVSAPWAQVTLYYSSFFAANALLGMFGGWVGSANRRVRVVDVERGIPGDQELKIHRKFKSPSGASGSHHFFWDVFYDATASISAWAPLELAAAFVPVNGDVAWQIKQRNSVNYDMYYAWASSMDFGKTFRPTKLSRLAGPARLQLDTTERMIRIALHFAQTFALAGEGQSGSCIEGSRLHKQRRLVTTATPNLVKESALADLLSI